MTDRLTLATGCACLLMPDGQVAVPCRAHDPRWDVTAIEQQDADGRDFPDRCAWCDIELVTLPVSVTARPCGSTILETRKYCGAGCAAFDCPAGSNEFVYRGSHSGPMPF